MGKSSYSLSEIINHLACPATGEALRLEKNQLVGETATYPMIFDIPWLFPDPKHVLADWRERADVMMGQIESEIADLKTSAKESNSELTKKRLEAHRSLRIQQLEMLKKVLEPLKPGVGLSLPKKQAFGYRLPLRQGLLGYFPNLVRDWGSDFETENAALLEATLSTLQAGSTVEPKNILVLGAGGARLAYDLAMKYPAARVVAFDINPVLLLTAKMVNEGGKVTSVEESFAPRDRMQPGRAVALATPNGTASNLSFVFGDVYALPFKDQSFDVCVSPWLVDIVPRRFQELAASTARVVAKSGRWVNCGAWFFDFQSQADNISLPEAEEIARANGWNPEYSAFAETPYLQSTFDNHRRFETMTLFQWRRNETAASDRPATDDRIEWIRDINRPIPKFEAFLKSSETFAVMAWVLAQVDGRRTLKDIAALIGKENGLTEEQAIEAASSFFDRYLKDRRFREQ